MMETYFFKELKPFHQLIFFLLISFLSGTIISFFGALAGNAIFGQEVFSSSLYQSDSNASVIRYMQGISQIGLYLVPPFIFAKIFHHSVSSYLSFNHQKKYNYSVLLFILLFITTIPIVEDLALLNQMIEFPHKTEIFMQELSDKSDFILSKMLQDKTVKGLLGNILIIGILPAFAEELFFRGTLQQIFIQWIKKHHLAIIIIAILFSAIHLDFANFLPRFFLGLILGYSFFHTKTLWTPIIIHLINNLTNVFILYFSDTPFSSNIFYFDGKIIPLIISIAASFVIILLLRKQLLKIKSEKDF